MSTVREEEDEDVSINIMDQRSQRLFKDKSPQKINSRNKFLSP